MFETIITVLQIIVSVVLIAVILLQIPEGGLSPVFGGGGGEMYRSKRSVEKFLVVVTIILAVLLVAFSITLLFIHG